MKRKIYSVEWFMPAVKQHELSKSVAEMARMFGITEFSSVTDSHEKAEGWHSKYNDSQPHKALN